MKEKTLVVMAAGMGSRFGGPKQVTPVGPNGEFIIDYSAYDAICAGFDKIVFIIKKDFQEVFDEKITKNLKDRIKVEYAYQDVSMVPSDVVVPSERVKPWGTTHAILCAKDKINGDFAIINADDFYGRDAYLKASEFFDNSLDKNEMAVISYPFSVTASLNGSVKRAVLNIDENGYINDLEESKIEIQDDKAKAESLVSKEVSIIDKDAPVSMNLFCFKNGFLKMMEEDFNNFIHQDEEKLLSGESLVPDTVKKYLLSNNIKLKNIVTSGKWAGVTYPDDLPMLKNTICDFINSGEYPENLWKSNNLKR